MFVFVQSENNLKWRRDVVRRRIPCPKKQSHYRKASFQAEPANGTQGCCRILNNAKASDITHNGCYETDNEEEWQQPCACNALYNYLTFLRVAGLEIWIMPLLVSFDKIVLGKGGYSTLYE